MSKRIRLVIIAIAGAALLLWVPRQLAVRAAQDQEPAAAQDNGIAGAWRLNKDLSAEPAPATEAGQLPPGGRSGGGIGGRTGSSGRGGGRGFGGRSGGGFGGGRGGAMGGASVSQEDQARMRELTREMNQPPERLALEVSGTGLIVTDDTGAVRTFPIGEKKDVDFGSVSIDVRTRWDGATLIQDFKGGPMTMTRTFQVVTGGRQLVVTYRTSGGRGGQQPSMKYVYDRE